MMKRKRPGFMGKLNHAPVLEDEIDWRRFGARAAQLLEKLGKKYYIKKDLAEHLEGIGYRNTEFRRAEGVRSKE